MTLPDGILRDAILNELRMELEKFVSLLEKSDRNMRIEKSDIDRSRIKIESLQTRLDGVKVA